MKEPGLIVKSRFPKQLSLQIKAKINLFGAIAHFHTKPTTSNERAVAERLARLNICKRMITLSLGFANEIGGVLMETVKVDRV
jgi:hypothetical protein